VDLIGWDVHMNVYIEYDYTPYNTQSNMTSQGTGTVHDCKCEVRSYKLLVT